MAAQRKAWEKLELEFESKELLLEYLRNEKNVSKYKDIFLAKGRRVLYHCTNRKGRKCPFQMYTFEVEGQEQIEIYECGTREHADFSAGLSEAQRAVADQAVTAGLSIHHARNLLEAQSVNSPSGRKLENYMQRHKDQKIGGKVHTTADFVQRCNQFPPLSPD